MPTNYPYGANNGLDDFQVTSDPSNTALSQRGQGGNRNHVESHTDMGDAIEALENYAVLKTHDHSGATSNPADRTKGYKLKQVNTHEDNDLDSSLTAIHHTLTSNLPTYGTAGRYQAAAGNHTHIYSTLVDTPLRLCTSGSRPSGVAPGTMIYESDTNRMRVWGQFNAANTLVTGIDATDSFDRVSATSLGTSLWQQVYTLGGAGAMATPDGNHASWIDSGDDPSRCIARRINSADAVTLTDNQSITWKTGGTAMELYATLFGATASSNDMYFRMNTGGTSYLRASFNYDQWGRGRITFFATKTGPAGEQQIGTLNADTAQTNVYWVVELKDYTFSVYNGETLEGTVLIGRVTDTNQVSNKGASYRGWGIGMVAGNRQGLDAIGFGQVTPANISLVSIKDMPYYTGTPLWQLLPTASVPIVRLRQNSTPQQIAAAGTLIRWGSGATGELEDNFNYYNPATPSSITITESGLYHLNVGIQWNTSLAPELGTVVACIGVVEQDLLNTAYQKVGTALSPVNWSQTLALSGKIRLAVGDVLSIKVKHSATNLINQILSYIDGPSKINSRLDLIYVSP